MEETATADHQLWVSLNALGEGNVFEALPDIMKNMMAECELNDVDGEFFDVVLPSDDEWKTKIYYKLVEKQRLMDNCDEKMFERLEDTKIIKMHDWNIKPKTIAPCEPRELLLRKKKKPIKVKTITWTVSDIAKAGCLLQTPPIGTQFEDEQEMRRVYTLIYDVFRYKRVLGEALDNVTFFSIFPMLEEIQSLVWLLLYDLYHRQFKKRETKVQAIASKLFESAGLSFVENALWTQRVKLAASIARLRIKNNALTLSELLPHHLRDERLIDNETTKPVTCWVNTNRVQNRQDLCEKLEREFQLRLIDINLPSSLITVNGFKFDNHCPQIIEFHTSMRTKLSRSDLVKNHELILQDKSFCLGPATFDKLLSELELAGTVIQTHVNSPRSTAYLAVLLSQNEKVKKLLAFSAGQRKIEYDNYFKQLGMNNVLIFSERLIDTRADAQYMEEVVAVFATPPNSYSAVADPIDLVCSRGGDLTMLQVLTESKDSKEGKERVAQILDEQRKTLRFAMSRPQIQFVLYETHSELDAENKGMVDRALRDINKISKIHHATMQGKLFIPNLVEGNEINNNEKGQDDAIPLIKKSSDLLKAEIGDQTILDTVNVPDTDIFDVPELPNLCPSQTKCANSPACGCFLSYIKRKEIIRLDDKYMIQMAENRGLFGSNTSPAKAKSSKKKEVVEERKPKVHRRRLKSREESTCKFNRLPRHSIAVPEDTSKEIKVVPLLSNIFEEEKIKNKLEEGHRRYSYFSVLKHITNVQIRPLVCPFYRPPKEYRIFVKPTPRINRESQQQRKSFSV
ncbi:uncharacterized protein LOC109594730 isoform X2 [Aethina tumida]|uniref:uncharacterized protein LOC109594730 isoform X2 n=1 Tax=Aethina tumida TaxID=116153 RepID=UPI00096B661B|nr:uncharacterized protein LOC109594730 isoform X2 [Aethina tumida]